MKPSVHVVLHVAQSLMISTPSRSLSGKSEVLVNSEFSDARVPSGKDGKAHDDGKRNQFGRNLLELSQPLGDGVAGLVLLRDRSHHASGRAEHSESLGATHVEKRRLVCTGVGRSMSD